MSEIKLTRQSEKILDKLREEFRHHTKDCLTADELKIVRKGLEFYDSAGIVRRFIVGLAIFIGSLSMLLNYFPALKKLLRIE